MENCHERDSDLCKNQVTDKQGQRIDSFGTSKEVACNYELPEGYGYCEYCGETELIGNLEVNEGLCNECYSDHYPY